MSQVDCQPDSRKSRWMPESDPAMWTATSRQPILGLDAFQKDYMSRSASYHPISQLIARIISDSGLCRAQFIRSLGYRSIQGGLRRLDEFLELGQGDNGILDRLVTAYHVDSGDLGKALAATGEMK